MTIRRLCWNCGCVRSRATSVAPSMPGKRMSTSSTSGCSWPAMARPTMPSCARCKSTSGNSWASKSCTRFWKWVESSISNTQGRGRGGGAGGGGWASAVEAARATDAAEATDGVAAAGRVAGAAAALAGRDCSHCSTEARAMRRCPPGVFQAWSSPRSTISCTERTAMPRACATSRVVQSAGRAWIASMSMRLILSNKKSQI